MHDFANVVIMESWLLDQEPRSYRIVMLAIQILLKAWFPNHDI